MENKTSFFSNYPFEIVTIDYSSYILIICCVILFLYFIWFIVKKKRKQQVLGKKELLLAKLHALNFSTTKQKKLAYDFTLLGKTYIDKENKEFEIILKELEVYKYHNHDIKIDPDLLKKMKRFIDELE
ncbi:MAG TPA: hypothetical protein ENK66_10240 [Arcobacter sp.]|jgi:hypothetical protein|nr:hypothetical protein [Arcobacter sp.]